MRLTFGKHKGLEVSHLETKYMSWLLSQQWFINRHPELRVEVRKYLIGRLLEEMPSSSSNTKVEVKSVSEFVNAMEGLV